ncbi:MAG TPA: cation-translocating P-type ATPase [Chitinophagaceae bacterium]|nr:cation-translocating P-type ATPase [Chitinophagaceae bacterium]
MNWHQLTAEEVIRATHTSRGGLSQAIATERLRQEGPNELPEKPPATAVEIFFRQFKDAMIVILLAAAVLAGITGETGDMLVIISIVLLNAITGFVQEYRANRAMMAIKKLDQLTAMVMRDKSLHNMDAAALVTGDIVRLEAGMQVPADLRLFDTFALFIEEATLTGEAAPVAKEDRLCPATGSALGDRFNMAYKGTAITSGRGWGVVVATGARTELGRISQLLDIPDSSTPLQRKMTAFSKRLSYVILLVCLLILVIGIMRGEQLLNMVLISIALAVAAIPEALPALITLSLAMAAKKMVSKNVLVRRLSAVETIGAVTIICTDKTGTLTENKMKVVEIWDQQHDIQLHEAMPNLLLLMALNHTVEQGNHGLQGDPTELALLNYVHEQVLPAELTIIQQQYTKVTELPFDAIKRCMTTIHHFGNGYLLITKGAAETLVSLLQADAAKENILQQTHRLSSMGMRVMAYGFRLLPALPEAMGDHVVNELVFGGLAAMIDPARSEVPPAIQACKTAGIMPVMITGDHPATAASIAKQTGITAAGDLMLTGEALEKMSPQQLDNIIGQVKVYARVSPQQKLDIIRAMQRMNHFIAMTGDGVNDAPSLKAADIGIAMGISGTDVSKEAADMILLDDNFASIVKGVKEGRKVYDNIRKFVKYILTCNSAEVYIIFLAPLLGLSLPLLPIQILWINLVTDGLPGLALAAEKEDSDIMQRPPRGVKESLFASGIGLHILWAGVLLAALLLTLQAVLQYNKVTHWNSIVFTSLSLAQLAHVLAVRSEHAFIWQLGWRSNPPLAWVLIVSVLLQVGLLYIPAANRLFSLSPLPLNELLLCLLVPLVFFHAVELEKAIKRSRRKNNNHLA